MKLTEARLGETYLVKKIDTKDDAMASFLFSLGCYSGEPITVISHKRGGCVVVMKDARYSMDPELASIILV